MFIPVIRTFRPAAWVFPSAVLAACVATNANAQSGYYASIAYSQSTGKIGYSYRQARTKETADAYAMRMCGTPDAKVFMWARDEWVAIAVVDGFPGNAGFGRGQTSDEAQQRALAECGKRANGHAHRVALCVHSSGMTTSQLLKVAAKPPTSRTGFFAAIAYSPSTKKVGHSVAEAKTPTQAQELAVKKCGAADAKAFMWGAEWVAVAVSDEAGGAAGFGPGLTRQAAEAAALEQCKKFSHGAPCKIKLVVHSSGLKNPTPAPEAAAAATATPQRPSTSASTNQVQPVSSAQPTQPAPQRRIPQQ